MTRDHIVPRQMIRRFAGEDGQLSHLHKPTLQLRTHRKWPREILFSCDYYKDVASNLDDTMLKDIEQRFALHYDTIVSSPGPKKLDGKASLAFIDWTASMLARTGYTLAATGAIWNTESMNPVIKVLMEALPNEVRAIQFKQKRDLLGRQNWKWKLMTVGDAALVITDNPVVLTKIPKGRALIVLVPLATNVICIGGHDADLALMGSASPRQLNFHLAGWANQSVYACSDAPLLELKEDLSADTRFAQSARQPYLGHIDRIPNLPKPGPGQARQFWKGMADGFGSSPFDDEGSH